MHVHADTPENPVLAPCLNTRWASAQATFLKSRFQAFQMWQSSDIKKQIEVESRRKRAKLGRMNGRDLFKILYGLFVILGSIASAIFFMWWCCGGEGGICEDPL